MPSSSGTIGPDRGPQIRHAPVGRRAVVQFNPLIWETAAAIAIAVARNSLCKILERARGTGFAADPPFTSDL
jgi:hypothetical protein